MQPISSSSAFGSSANTLKRFDGAGMVVCFFCSLCIIAVNFLLLLGGAAAAPFHLFTTKISTSTNKHHLQWHSLYNTHLYSSSNTNQIRSQAPSDNSFNRRVPQDRREEPLQIYKENTYKMCIHLMNFRMSRGLIWKKWSSDGQHGAVVAMYQFSLPGKTTAFLHAWLGEKSFSSLKTTEKPSSKLCLFPAHALACIVDFLLAISQLVQRGF